MASVDECLRYFAFLRDLIFFDIELRSSFAGEKARPTYVLGTCDFDAQMSGIKFRKGDENLRTVYKKLLLACSNIK
jgi:hypothetical protein